MTGSLAAVHAVAAPVETSLPAVGVQRAAWLLLVFPLAGAAILLLGGRRTDRWGHWVGVLMPDNMPPAQNPPGAPVITTLRTAVASSSALAISFAISWS